MTDVQKGINSEYDKLLKSMKEIYPSLLNRMESIATNLKVGQDNIIKDLRANVQSTGKVTEDLVKVNTELHRFGNEISPKFRDAFADLNEAYIEKINDSNVHLKGVVEELLKATAVLSNVMVLNNQQESGEA